MASSSQTVSLPGRVYSCIFMVLFSGCFDWAWKKSPTRQLQEACFNSEAAKTEMAAISGRDPSEFKAFSQRLKPWQRIGCGYGSKLGTPKLWMVNTKLD